MGTPDGERVLSLAALGRPFRLGMLYDSRTERLIPGITLWDEATLQNKTEQQLETSDFHVSCSDSLDDKASALEVNASLKLSFLGGLVEVEGAAKYLDNRKSSSHQERVTLQYKCTTRSESMTMEQLGQGRVQHQQVFDHGTATHVVTSIIYGAQAFFIFDRQHSSSSHEKEVEGNVHALIRKIPCIKIDGKGELQLSENEKKKTEEFTCRFFGDFLLRQNPSSFSDAVRLYQELPKLLGVGGEKAVPVKVQLYPLCLIDNKAIRLVREISVNLVSETEKFFEDMQEISIKCKDILKSDAVKRFQGIEYQIREYINITETYKRMIQKELSEMLPRIRGGGDEEGCLVELLNKMSRSPLSCLALRSWLQAKCTQVKVLNEYTKALGDIKFATEPGDLESVIMNPDSTYSLCLSISIPSHDSQLETMKRCCHETQFMNTPDVAGGSAAPQQINSNSMMEVATVFRNFYSANETKKELSFLVSQEFCESDAFFARVKCYKYGRLVSGDYELPSAPERVMVEDTTHDSVTISWSPPKYGASSAKCYVVSCCKEGEHSVFSTLTVNPDHRQASIPCLDANTAYEFRVWARDEVGDGPVGNAIVTVRTRPASPPQHLRTLKRSPTKICLKWMPPSCVANGCKIEGYIVKEETSASHWVEKARTSGNKLSHVVNVDPNTVARFKVAASCGPAGVSRDSDVSIMDPATPVTLLDLKECICDESSLIQNNPNIYKPNLKEVSRNSVDMIEKLEFGDHKPNVTEKVIMLVGATGSGKTTLINGLVNYIFGVEWKDQFRFKMVLEPNVSNQAMSQTTKITSYTLHHQEGFRVPYTLTIIDTPGFGDVSGIMRDKEITESIRKFFTAYGADGISHIDAVGFVANSSLPRLTPTQKYIFDQILSLFGKDIADNIFLLLTFADGKKPQVLSGIKEAKIPYKKHFKFNNSALYAHQSSECDENEHDSDADEGEWNFDSLFWDMGFRSFDLFLKQLNIVESKSLILTQDVLTERNRLQIYVIGIQRDIRQGLTTLERLRKEIDMLQTHHADIERNKNFEYEVEEEIYVQTPIPSGQYITNCIHCNRTCHENCKIPEDQRKSGCTAMKNGSCRICPGKCHWTMHKNFPFKYELTMKKTKKTVNELRQRYEEATQKKLTTENLIEEVNGEFEALKVKVLGMTNSVRKSLQRLQEIALRPNPLTTVQYIDILMESERSQAEPGWQARLEQLSNVRKEAEYMEMIADKGFDPFKQYIEKIQIKTKATKHWTSKVISYCKKNFISSDE